MFLEFDKSHFEISSTETYENCSMGPKIHFEISIVSSYPYFEISIVEIQQLYRENCWDLSFTLR